MFVGIDIGSSTAKGVLWDGSKIVASSILPTGTGGGAVSQQVMDLLLKQGKITEKQIKKTVATGYGRVSVPFEHVKITEISCHAKGMSYACPGVNVVIDIGGQDMKVIKIDSQGNVVDFAMNDKCAAGTGRFLTVMASAMGIDLSLFGELSMQAKEEIVITNTCTVFAESEVVSLLGMGRDIPSVIKAINRSVADKAFSLIRSKINTSLNKKIIMAMSGGVAKNRGVRKALEEMIGLVIKVPEEPQMIGALGAALLAETR